MDSGIYLITVRHPSGLPRYYVGSSKAIKSRWRWHRRALRNGVHHNIRLQRLYAALGDAAFEFDVVEICATADLHATEQWWLDEMHGNLRCVNLSSDATAPWRGKTMTAEQRTRISAGGKGLQRSAETRARIAAANAGALNSMYGRVGAKSARSKGVESVCQKTLQKTVYGSACLAEKEGFHQAAISRCCAGKQASHMGRTWRFTASGLV